MCFIQLSLKDVTKFHEYSGALLRVPNVDAQEHTLGRVEPEPDSACGLQIAQIEITRPRRHLTGIAKERHIQSGECFPSILRIEDDHVSVMETELRITAQVVGAAE